MNNILATAIGLFIPFAGTTLGAAMVFTLKNGISDGLQKALLGFASGVMMAASVFSLLIPAIDMAGEAGMIEWLPAVVGFVLGMAFLLALDNILPHLHAATDEREGPKANISKSLMMILAITIHNIPEGMAVGVVLASVANGSRPETFAAALALSIGMAVQNFPEGAVSSMPLVANGVSRKKAFGYGFLTGVVEPISAIIAILLTNAMTNVLPFVLAFAAGTMVYVIVEEMIPEAAAGKHSNIATIGVCLGFALMMILDVALG